MSKADNRELVVGRQITHDAAKSQPQYSRLPKVPAVQDGMRQIEASLQQMSSSWGGLCLFCAS